MSWQWRLLNEANIPGAEPGPWSDLFVDWCFVEAFSKEIAKGLLYDYFEPFTTYSAEYYRTKGLYFDQPQIGNLIFLKKNERICHTGILYDIDSTMVYTIEGDTIPEPGIRDEGVLKNAPAFKQT